MTHRPYRARPALIPPADSRHSGRSKCTCCLISVSGKDTVTSSLQPLLIWGWCTAAFWTCRGRQAASASGDEPPVELLSALPLSLRSQGHKPAVLFTRKESRQVSCPFRKHSVSCSPEASSQQLGMSSVT